MESDTASGKYKIVIVGGGASGFAAAIAAAHICKEKSVPTCILILEKQDRALRKLLATGNGRCNLTNHDLSDRHYHGNTSFCRGARKSLSEDTTAFFSSLGLLCAEEEGRIYPLSGQASSVLDVLRFEADKMGVEIRTNTEAKTVEKHKNRFKIRFDGGEVLAEKLIIAAGGAAAPALGGGSGGYDLLASMGHSLEPVSPALVQLRSGSPIPKQLKGIRITGSLRLEVNRIVRREERGEVLFTDYGFSGIAVMQTAREAGGQNNKKAAVEAVLDLLPEFSLPELLRLLNTRAEANPDRTLENFFAGMFHKKVGQALLKDAGIGPLSRLSGSFSEAEIKTLAQRIKGWRFPIEGTMGFENAQVTAGGIRSCEFHADTMESRLVKGLYACGEILDVDGDCGGYNLDWAWTSGRIAGLAAAGER